MTTLSTLTLDQISGLTDEECDALYGELGGWVKAEGSVWRRVCHPDCSASVLEGLPEMVERWTGVPTGLYAQVDHQRGNRGAWADIRTYGGPKSHEPYLWLESRAQPIVFRHLPHACLSAAFAACVVLGRKG